MPSRYEDHAALEVRGEIWKLARSRRFDACTILTLEGRDRSNSGERFHVIEPFDRPRLIGHNKLRSRSRRAVMAAALCAIAGARRATGLWTAADSTIDLWPYQLEPALAVIHGATRLLLADAVGLGKTIQAGLILSELRERGWIEHSLIVCPAGLRATWARELRERFHITATVLDQASIADRIAELPRGVSPWSGHAVAIASIDFVKRPEVLAAIDREPIDLVIADEAHHLAPGTDRGAAVSRLAARAPWCVFVSATPHSGDRAAFEYLTSMGAAGDPIAIFRRRRADAGLSVSRRSHVLEVQPTDDEIALLGAIERYARAMWIARGREDRLVRLIAMTLARRAASSAAAITRTLVRRLALLGNPETEPAQSSLPWEETDEADDLEADALLAARGLHNDDEERAIVESLIALTARCRSSSKIHRLLRLLRVTGEPAVVFTEYRDTLDAVVDALARASLRVVSIHGGVAPDLRRVAVDAFNGGRADVLVATDAAGEGLNLHHRCRLVVDVELPWNPMRLEQRIGRVDRLGQRRVVHAIHLCHPGTIESTVLDHLRIRRQRAEEALDRPASDSDVAAAIFDGTQIERDTFEIRSAAIEAAPFEAARLEQQRRLAARFGSTAGRAWSPPQALSRSPLIALHRVSFVNESGDLIGEQMQATRTIAGPQDRARWRRTISDLDAIVLPHTLEQPPARAALERRIHSIRARLTQQQAVRYQRSLFDQRADADAAARQAVLVGLDAALGRVLRSVTSPVSIKPRIELIAAWPERRR